MKARWFSLALVIALGGLVTGCGGEGASESSSSGMSAGSDAKAAPPALGSARSAADSAVVPAESAVESKTGAGRTAASAAVARLVRTADLTIQVPDVPAAAANVRKTAVALGGIVSNEVTNSSAQPQSVITLRVPEPRMDEALNKVSSFGRQLSRDTSSKDVTASIADLNSRVNTQTRSVNRIRDLMSSAKSLKDIVLIESELSRREADLEALQARQRVLNDQADLSTITVTLRATAPKAVAAKDDSGFLGGLRNGWHALGASTTVVLTVLGAVLPIAVVLALIGVPGYLLYRRLPRFRPGGTPATTLPPTTVS
jgi:Domain of unknown function (DUF4349)